MRLHHVQLAIPPGSESACRRFYGDVLGWTEIDKPPLPMKRGGLWLQAGQHEVHLGVEEGFQPARKAHPGFMVADLDGLADRLAVAGAPVKFDDAIPGIRRFYTEDAVGNRLEFMQEP